MRFVEGGAVVDYVLFGVIARESEGTNLPKDAAAFLSQIGAVASTAPEELRIPWELGDRYETWRVIMVSPSARSADNAGLSP
jgi:hypothetical protein